MITYIIYIYIFISRIQRTFIRQHKHVDKHLNIPTDPHTVTTTDIKADMRHIHTSIVSRHLATRGNNKILCTPPPHISSSEERLTRRTLAQLRTNKSPFLKSYLHKVDTKTHPSPLCPVCNTYTHDTHHPFNCTHIVTSGFVDRPHRSDCTAGQMEEEAGWWDHKREHRTPPPPLAKVMGVGRQQQHLNKLGNITVHEY